MAVSEQFLVAADTCLRPLKVRRIFGFETPARVLLWVLYTLTQFGLVALTVVGFSRMQSDDWSPLPFVLSSLVLLALVVGYFRLGRRLPQRSPVHIRQPENRFVDRHAIALQIATAVAVGVVAIGVTVYLGVR
ncbi:MAG: hypothetical protein ABF306_19070 [Nocardioides marinisabuli]|uniref:hypothetical protein n=1 Tax=Nocardioides marinisabuli TaxID=419476 RepID=UPI003219A6DA